MLDQTRRGGDARKNRESNRQELFCVGHGVLPMEMCSHIYILFQFCTRNCCHNSIATTVEPHVICGLRFVKQWCTARPHDHTKQNRLSMIQKMKKDGDGFQKTSSILLVLCVHTHMCLLQTGRPVWYTHAHFQNSMLNVQKLHVPGYCRFMTGTFLRDCVLHVHFVSGLGGRILVLGVHRSTPSCVVCGTCTRTCTLPHTHQGSARRN